MKAGEILSQVPIHIAELSFIQRYIHNTQPFIHEQDMLALNSFYLPHLQSPRKKM
jgi:hypothetical protein